ncbi:MAG: sulfurtransferase [Chloroflexi bacterium]|nr:sulfurtransferase [Chloroflexota bacterium]
MLEDVSKDERAPVSRIRLQRQWIVLWLLAALLVLTACAREATPTPTATPAPVSAYPNAHLLVETSWLQANLDAPGMRLLDVRSPDRYAAGHLPDALNLPLSRISVNQPFPNELPPVSQIETALAELGIGDDTVKVVLYDENRGMVAARVFWTLEYFGLRDKVAILNGGFPKWQQENRPITQAVPEVTPAQFTARPEGRLLITGDALLGNLGKPGFTVMDTRSLAEYVGQDLRGNMKGGHVPGAVNVNWEDTMTPGDAGVWKPAGELAAMFVGKGLTQNDTVAVYCQTGVRAAHGYFTLRLMGFDKVTNYDGSMAEWNNRTDTPVETEPVAKVR